MNAKEMFECLGYQLIKQADDKLIMYGKITTDYNCIDEDDEPYNTWQKCSYRHYIVFELKSKEVHLYSQTYDYRDEYSRSLNVLEIMAINKQIKELGWLESEE